MSREEYIPKDLWKTIFVVIMFPSTAILSEFECPLYKRGLCSRPFCKYRHVEHAVRGNVCPVAAQGKQTTKYISKSGSVTLEL